MRPSKRFILIIATWLLTAVIVASTRALADEPIAGEQSILLYLVLLGFALIAFFDYFQSQHFRALHATRNEPSGLAVAAKNPIAVHVKNTGSRAIHFQLTELVGAELSVHGFPYAGVLEPSESLALQLAFYPVKRGVITLGGLQALIESPLGLWQAKRRFGKTQNVNVYPNFTAVSHFELLAHGNDMSHLGVHLKQRRGEGLDFRQLREFRAGDALRQVDWKASSRYNKPISREFQDERDQDIIFLLDNGRRMRSKDGDLSHFDHCLNAMLLCSYVALRQGDAVGLMSFGSELRWQAPVKGRANLNVIMQRVFDLHSSTAASDYVNAAAELIKKHKKRSLIVLVTNADGYLGEELSIAIKLLKKHHLVVVACLREEGVERLMNEDVQDFNAAVAHCAAAAFIKERRAAVRNLTNKGAIVLDEHARHLHVGLVNTYFELKRSGQL